MLGRRARRRQSSPASAIEGREGRPRSAPGFKNMAFGWVYTDSAKQTLAAALEKDGIRTSSMKGLQIIDPRECIKHKPESAYRLGREVFEQSGRKADGILISCGGFRSF